MWWKNYFIQFVFTVCQVEGYQKILKLSCFPLAFTLHKAFLKDKKRSGTILPTTFLHNFWRKTFILLYSIKVLFLVAFISWDIGQYVYCNCLLNMCDVTNVEISLIVLIKPFFFCMTKKSSHEFKYLENEKSFQDEMKIISHNF